MNSERVVRSGDFYCCDTRSTSFTASLWYNAAGLVPSSLGLSSVFWGQQKGTRVWSWLPTALLRPCFITSQMGKASSSEANPSIFVPEPSSPSPKQSLAETWCVVTIPRTTTACSLVTQLTCLAVHLKKNGLEALKKRRLREWLWGVATINTSLLIQMAASTGLRLRRCWNTSPLE